MEKTSCEKMLNKIDKTFCKSVKHPEIYLSVQNKKADNVKNLVKILYGLENFNINGLKRNEVPAQLLIDHLDEEQIWQQIELKNESILKANITKSSKLLSANDGKFQLERLQNEESIQEESSGNEEEQQAPEEEEQEVAPSKSNKRKLKTQNGAKNQSVVDDDFFKLNEMAQFLDAEDKKEMNKSKGPTGDEEINMHLFNDEQSNDGSASESENVKYTDFFDLPEDEENEGDDNNDDEDQNQDSFIEDNLEHEDEEMESEKENEDRHRPTSNEAKSSYELQQEQLKQNIAKFENQILSDKPWQLKGEITAESRPQNSLLEDYLEFDVTTRPAPIITEKTTFKLEDIVRQRIRDKAYDDVERKHKPTQTPQEYRKKLILDQEKSKESLAKIYEKEYLKEMEKLDPNADDKEEEEPKEHKEIRKLLKTLFTKLDALSNAHYTPKPAAPELKIITNTPAINMEEVAPVSVSDRNLLAPEEIKTHAKGDVIGKSERTKTDKKRERRAKKQLQKSKRVQEEAREKDRESKGLKATGKDVQKKMMDKVMKYKNVDKMQINDDSKHIKSSTSFFAQLQDQVTAPVKVVKMSKKIASKAKNDAKKFKL